MQILLKYYVKAQFGTLLILFFFLSKLWTYFKFIYLKIYSVAGPLTPCNKEFSWPLERSRLPSEDILIESVARKDDAADVDDGGWRGTWPAAAPSSARSASLERLKCGPTSSVLGTRRHSSLDLANWLGCGVCLSAQVLMDENSEGNC